LAQLFIKFLTVEGDLVLDPFAGSNTTGAAAEILGRRWVSVEPQDEYVEGSKGRFAPGSFTEAESPGGMAIK
jgi:site-specific DNA-methyltransferase (cytosine-N4-specific)